MLLLLLLIGPLDWTRKIETTSNRKKIYIAKSRNNENSLGSWLNEKNILASVQFDCVWVRIQTAVRLLSTPVLQSFQFSLMLPSIIKPKATRITLANLASNS